MKKFLVILSAIFCFSIQAQSLKAVSSFGDNPGALDMYIYSSVKKEIKAPVVVLLHGCTQSANDYDDETGWVALAEKFKFRLILAEQRFSNNFNTCFNWYQPGDITRNNGEAKSIISMVEYVVKNYATEKNKIFVTGLSAGGAMTSALLASYPDVFSAGGIVAGIPVGCARDILSGLSCMKGADRTPEEWAKVVKSLSKGYKGPYPRVSIWHGSNDTVVAPKLAIESAEQWLSIHGLTKKDGVKKVKKKLTKYTFSDKVELNIVESMAHGQSINSDKGCGSAIPYILDEGVCTAAHLAKFFGLLR